MRTLKRVSGGITALSIIVGLAGVFGMPVPVAHAATTPSLGQAASYGVLTGISGTYTNTTVTTINGDVGFTTGPATAPLPPPRPSITYPNYGETANDTPQARLDAAAALPLLAAQPCTYTFPAGAIDLATDVTNPNGVGIYIPGVYCSTGAMTVGAGGPFAGITLNGSGTYIFRTLGVSNTLTVTTGATVTLNGSSACDVFWTPTAATTIGASSIFAGTIIDNANAITVNGGTTWSGRAITLGAGTVTTDTSTITVPTCAAPPSSGDSDAFTGTINVVKTVINDNGGTKVVSNFPLFVDGVQVVSGVTNNYSFFSSSAHVVTETGTAGYTQSFSGDCDENGVVWLDPAENAFCVLTNNDIGAPVVVPPVPPLIDVVKVPSPLALPLGPGLVNYTYTTRNPGTVPLTNVTMVGDTCSPIVLASGDTDADARLDVNETWVYTCSTTLTETHTNTVVATGWANGLSAVDIASATVVVGVPIVPPLIHVTKVPSPLALTAGGGSVTYTEKVTNPGTVPLSNVTLNDDTCSPMVRISGDTNGDSLLDPSETWTYTCTSNLTATTTNTAVATGQANGITVRDFAIATVVVAAAVPALPNTGITPAQNPLMLIVAAVGLLSAMMAVGAIRKYARKE